MSWRIDATAKDLSRTASLPSMTAFTICGWAYRVNDRVVDYEVCCYLADSTTSPTREMYIAWRASGSGGGFVLGGQGGQTAFASEPGTGVWVFVAMTCSGTGVDQFIGYKALASDSGFETVSRQETSSFTTALMRFGATAASGDWIDGRIAGLKVWDAALSSAELWSERWSLTPVRRANLHLFAPGFRHTELDDMSGSGRTLTANGTLSTEEGPPVPWARSRGRFIWPVGAAAVGQASAKRFGGITDMGRQRQNWGIW